MDKSQERFDLENKLTQDKCIKHSKYPLDLLRISKDTTNHRICIICLREDNIPMQEVITIKELLESKDGTAMLNLSQTLMTHESSLQNIATQTDSFILQVDEYFKELQEKISEAIFHAKAKTKLKLSNISSIQQKFQNCLGQNNDKAEELVNLLSQQLKQKDLPEEPSTQLQIQNQIHTTICELLDNTSAKNATLTSITDEYTQAAKTFNTESLPASTTHILNTINSISFFQEPTQSFLNSVQFKPHLNYKDSQQFLEIERIQDKIEITHTDIYNISKQGHLDIVIIPENKYIIRVEMEQHSQNNPSFYFGLMSESAIKEGKSVISSEMSYCENGNDYRTVNQLKGSSLFSNRNTRNLRKILEFRIFLKGRTMQVADYPKYESVIELADKGKYCGDEGYRFAANIQYATDIVRILDVSQVECFDDKFD